MNIDYNKLIQLLLPQPLRRVRITALVRVLVSPIARRCEGLRRWFEIRRVRLSVTPQAEWIQYIIRREAALEVSITEGDHRPYDFIVTAAVDLHDPAQLDAKRRAEALVDRYKQAGRRWRFNNSRLDVYPQFRRHLCVKGELAVQFRRHLCVRTPETVSITVKSNLEVLSHGEPFQMVAVAEHPVASPIMLEVQLNYSNGSQEIVSLEISRESTSSNVFTTTSDVAYINVLTTSGFTDDQYKYQIEIENNGIH